MRILMVTPCIPTGTDGRRPYNFLKHLCQEHEVRLLALKLPVQTQEQIDALAGLGIPVRAFPIRASASGLKCASGVLFREPLRVSWCRNAALRQAIVEELDRGPVDVVHFDRMRMGQYADCAPGIPKLVDFTDSLVMYLERSVRFRTSVRSRWIDKWERWTIPRFERRVLERVDAGLVCSPVDAEVLRHYHPGHRIDVIANSVGLEEFTPQSRGDAPPESILTGTLFYFPNIDSVHFWCDDILPKIHARRPEMRTRVIGTRPTLAMRALDGREGVSVHADVPRMADCLRTEDIYVCPLRVGAGVRNKLLEAMAAGMAIVSTTLGPEGMNVEPGKHLLLADTPEEFADAVVRLLDDRELKRRLGEAARNYVEENHCGQINGERLVDIYRRLIDARAARPSLRTSPVGQ